MAEKVETPRFVGAVRRMLRAAGKRAGDEDEPELKLLFELEEDWRQAVQYAVDRQRARGVTWERIAEAAGTSRQAVTKRWSKK